MLQKQEKDFEARLRMERHKLVGRSRGREHRLPNCRRRKQPAVQPSSTCAIVVEVEGEEDKEEENKDDQSMEVVDEEDQFDTECPLCARAFV